MNGRRFSSLLFCALVSSPIGGVTAQGELSISEGTTPSNTRALQFGILQNIFNNLLSNVNFALPDFSFSQDLPIAGAVTFSASNISCHEVSVDNLDVSIDPTGILEADFGINTEVRIECAMEYSIKGGFLLSDKGSLTLVSRENTFDIVASLSPTSLSFSNCSFNLATPELDFSGSPTSEILNLLEGTLVNTLDNSLGNLDVCNDLSSILGRSQDQVMPAFQEVLSRFRSEDEEQLFPVFGKILSLWDRGNRRNIFNRGRQPSLRDGTATTDESDYNRKQLRN